MAARIHLLRQHEIDLKAAGSAILDKATAEHRLELTAEEKAAFDQVQEQLARTAEEIEREETRLEWVRTGPATPERPTVTRMHNRAEDEPWGTKSGAPFGEFLQAVFHAQTGQGIDPRLVRVVVEQGESGGVVINAAAQGAGRAVGPDGGFLVGTTMADDLRLRVMTGSILSKVRPIPLDPGTDGIEINMIDESSRATGSRFGAVQGYWVDEGTAPSASRPKFHKFRLQVKGLAALGYATNQLLRNARALQDIMYTAFAEELRFLVEDAVINGSGAGKPLGILNADCLVSVAKETNQTAATIVYENLSKMWARLAVRSRANAVWLVNQDIEPQLDSLVLPAGTGALEPRFIRYNDEGVLQIKGRPVVPIEYAATLGTKGDILLADFSQYGYIEEAMESASSMHVAFTTNEMAFRVTYYVDGGPTWKSALTPFKGSNSTSPFISLDTRS